MTAAKNTIFSTKTTLNCKGRLLDLSTPVVMGIINVTPDSFYDGGFVKNESELLKHAEKMVKDGAAILDVGGMSSRPGSEPVSEEEELRRVLPAIEILHRNFPQTIISIDTWRSKVAREAVVCGAGVVNDISAGNFDPELLTTVAELKVPYVLMHMQGTPAEMQQHPMYEDVVREITIFFRENIIHLNELGIYDIVLDPGFGFGKTTKHNYHLLQHLCTFSIFGLPLLAGVSRKSLICKVLHTRPEGALNGTTVLNTIALMNGAMMLRVHDVKEAKEAIQLTEELKNAAV